MSNLYETIISLCAQSNTNGGKMCKDLGISRGILTDLKMGRKKQLSTESLSKIADYFGVSIDYLIGNSSETKTPTLTNKDERDISKKLQATLNELENTQDGLMFDGEPLDDITRELLLSSLKNSMEMGKKIAKQKFTPKKYR